MIYLLHKDFNGNPIGVWNEARESYYPKPNPLQTSAQSLVSNNFDGESWEDFTDRLSDRVSHRDWWETYESDKDNLQEVWYEIKPSDESL